MTIPARPFSTPSGLPLRQLEVMYLGLPLKERLVPDDGELALIESAVGEGASTFGLWTARAALTKDVDVAVESYSRALAARPLHSHSLYNRGRKMLGLGRYAQGVADLRLATTLDQDEPWKWHFLGVGHYFLDEYDQAVQAFERAAQASHALGADLLPFEVEWMWNCLQRAGRSGDAQAVLNRVDATTPVAASEATYKARILLYKGVVSPEEFEAGIDQDDIPERVNQLYGLANYHHYVIGDTEQSVALLRRVLDPAHAGQGWGYRMAERDLPGRTGEQS